jgi:hypothetical protein
MYRTPEQEVYYSESRLGIRPGTPTPKQEVHSKDDELEGLEADLAQWYDNFNDSKKAKIPDTDEIEEAKGLIVEIKENIETVKNETPEQRKKRIAKDGYLTDWLASSERYYKGKMDEII